MHETARKVSESRGLPCQVRVRCLSAGRCEGDQEFLQCPRSQYAKVACRRRELVVYCCGFCLALIHLLTIFFILPPLPMNRQVKAKKSTVKYVIDCTQPVDDHVLDVASFEKYLHERVKINNKTGQLTASNVVITRDRTKLTIASPAELNLNKRQFKYLSKRYLKKQLLKNFVRVVASSKNSYEMRYYNISADANNAADADE
jgi:large subunit ribosomal protein L22e